MKIIKIIGFANGQHCPFSGSYVRSFDFEAFDGLGHGVFTREPRLATKFKNIGEAWEFWKRQSNGKPFRADGKPNRPLTATSVEILEEPHD